MIQDYGFRLYNPSIGKFLSVDPLAPKFPWNSPYTNAENSVIRFIDVDGLGKDNPPIYKLGALEIFSVGDNYVVKSEGEYVATLPNTKNILVVLSWTDAADLVTIANMAANKFDIVIKVDGKAITGKNLDRTDYQEGQLGYTILGVVTPVVGAKAYRKFGKGIANSFAKVGLSRGLIRRLTGFHLSFNRAGDALSNIKVRGSKGLSLNDFQPGKETSFPGLYNTKTGEFLMLPGKDVKLKDGSIPELIARRGQGHELDVLPAIKANSGSSSTTEDFVAFTVTMVKKGKFEVGWISRSINNQYHDYINYGVKYKKEIFKALKKEFGVRVKQKKEIYHKFDSVYKKTK